MLKRIYSLKTRYNFRRVFRIGNTFHTNHLVIRYAPADTKRFGVVVSNRFIKNSVIQHKVRRLIFAAIKQNFNKFPNAYYVFIPKKNMLSPDGKITLDDKVFNTEINTFLSAMVVGGSRSPISSTAS